MRIAHLSDLHLLSLDGARARDFLGKRWTGGVNLIFNRGRHYRTEVFEALVADLNAQDVDEVLCTGDLTNLALEAEFRFARDRFDRLAHGPGHVTCIPGNHDAYVAETAHLFEAVFAPYCTADDGWAWGDGGGRWPVVRVRGDVAVVAVSSSLPTTWFMAWGSVGNSQLDRVARALRDPRLAGKCRVVMIHHPPAGPRARSLHRGLRDHAGFARAIAAAGAELVVHGHEHVDVRATLGGPAGQAVAVRGVPSGSYDGAERRRRARYRIFTVGGGAVGEGARRRVTGEAERVWDPAAGRFVPA